ncbi:MAG: hypothetical protein WC651_03505 [Candidatus Gracilibacteria bacterium]|jgi:hypothetical protein
MSGLRNHDAATAEGIPGKQLDGGQGFLREITTGLMRIPGLRQVIKSGVLLTAGTLGVAVAGCEPNERQQEVSATGYSILEGALAEADELKNLSTPQKVAGTEVGDASPEFGEIDGKKVMFIIRTNPQGIKSAYFKTGSNLKELMTQGVFAEIKGFSQKVLGITVYKNKAYIRSAGGNLFEANINFNLKNEIELSEAKEAQGGGDDIKVVEIDGVPYLYASDVSWTNRRKKLTTGEIEDLGLVNYDGKVPAYYNETWIGNRPIKTGGQEVSRAYYANDDLNPDGTVNVGSGFSKVAKSTTPVSKLNLGLQANTGDIAIAEDDDVFVAVMAKWNTDYPTSIMFSQRLKLPVNPELPLDTGTTEVDAGTQPELKPELPPEVEDDTGPQPDLPLPPEVADDAGIVPPDSGEVCEVDVPLDKGEVCVDVPIEPDLPLEVADDAGAQPDLPPEASQPEPTPEVSQPEPAPEVSQPEPAPEVSQPETTPPIDLPQPDIIELETKPDVPPKQDIPETVPETSTPDAKPDLPIPETAQPDTTTDTKPDLPPFETAQPAETANHDSGNPNTETAQPDTNQQTETGSQTPPPATPKKPGCSASPNSLAEGPKGVGALAALFATMIAAVYSRRRREA